jgi:hypothetical protein
MQASLFPPEAPAAGPYEGWLVHVDGCSLCAVVREELQERRIYRDFDRQMTVACPAGIRLVPLEDLELAVGPQGFDRGSLGVMLARLVDHARRLQGRGVGELQTPWRRTMAARTA